MKALKHAKATPFNYCSLAVSKNKNQSSIGHVFRDRDAIVATDGHRLHRVSQPKIETPHYLSGDFDATSFPNTEFLYGQHELLCQFSATNSLFNNLKAVCAVAGKKEPLATLTFLPNTPVRGLLEVSEEGLTRHVSFELGTSEVFHNATFTLNLRYLVEAIVWGGYVTLCLGIKTDAIKVCNLNGYEAYVMPVALPK